MRTSILAAGLFCVLLAASARAEVKTREIEYKQGDTVLLGYLAWDDAVEGKRPGVLIVHEWWGHDDYVRMRARKLASLGYVAFALDMYGKGRLATTPEEAGKLAGSIRGNYDLGIARARAGYDVLKAQPQVDPARIGAMGYCFGGTVSLSMARAGFDLKGVVSFHGSLGTDHPADAKTLQAKILVCNGGDDSFVPEAEQVKFKDEMRGARADWQFISYSGAVHSFTNPGADARGIPGVAYHKAADERSWEHMKLFWAECFSG